MTAAEHPAAAGPLAAAGPTPAPPAPAWGWRELILAWHLPLLASLLPMLLISFGASALANQLVFAS